MQAVHAMPAGLKPAEKSGNTQRFNHGFSTPGFVLPPLQ